MFRNIKTILPVLVILLAIILRLFKFEEFVTFLGDQGRDAIILKRIVTFEHFPAIGAPSSLGQIFLGPFYYYLVAPFLLIFNFNPLGPAFGVALFSIIGIIFAYRIVKKEIDFLAALFFLIFISLSAVHVQFSRFSWNPNLLPVFSFLTLYFFYKSILDKNKIYAILFGSFLSFSIQLHHLALLLLFPIFIIYLFKIFEIKNKSAIQQYGNMAISVLSFLFFSLPLLIFDLRHDFLNSKNLLKLFSEGSPTDSSGLIKKFIDTNQAFISQIFQIEINPYFAIVILIAFGFIFIKKYKDKKYLFLKINLLVLISYLLLFSLFNTPRNAHYFAPVYFSFFILSAFLLNYLLSKNIYRILTLLVIGIYIYNNVKSLDYLFLTRGNNQVKNARTVAESILKRNPKLPYQTIALPYVETDGHIRYFLELKGKRPLPAETLEEPKELYVLCFEKECSVLGNPQWQIAAFRNAKIDTTWTVEGIKIYKVIHSN